MNFFVKTCIILKICYFVFCEKDHAKIRNIINLSNISSITKRYIMKTLQMIHYFNFVIATVFVVFLFLSDRLSAPGASYETQEK